MRPSGQKGASDYHDGCNWGKYKKTWLKAKTKQIPKIENKKKSWDIPLSEWMTAFWDKRLSQDAEDRLE